MVRSLATVRQLDERRAGCGESFRTVECLQFGERRCSPTIVRRGRCTVVHTASIQRTLPVHESTASYAAAILRLSPIARLFPKKLDQRGSRANVVSPGWICTDAAQAMVKRIAASAGGRQGRAAPEHSRRAGLLPDRPSGAAGGSGGTDRLPAVWSCFRHSRCGGQGKRRNGPGDLRGVVTPANEQAAAAPAQGLETGKSASNSSLPGAVFGSGGT